MRALLPLALAAVAGCQCLVPVDDLPDAGRSLDGGWCRSPAECAPGTDCSSGAAMARVATCRFGYCGFYESVCPRPDAGTDGGQGDGGRPADGGALDAGPCTAAAQCTGSAPTSSWCAGSDAGFSCIERKCVWECPLTNARRTCIVDGGYGGCLVCGAQTICPINCPGAGGYNTVVESGSLCTVWPGTSIAFTNVTIMRTASAQCHYTAYQTAGAEQLGDIWRLSNDEYLAYFPSFGGWCTGRSAYTGAPRSIFNCPRCQFGLAGFE